MIVSFSEKKQELIEKLNIIHEKCKKIEGDFEVDLSEIMEKTEKMIKNIKNEKFSIAFFGAFSDGKSTILSALTNRLDIEIAPEPTTNEIKEYYYGDCLIVDTPGLYSEYIIHDKKTKKYISEANVVIYVVGAVNPLKESHHATVKWLIDDLDKANATIFVINKMDEVADLNDEEDYNRNSKIKKEVLEKTLTQILGRKPNVSIVCTAADPGGNGLDFWLSPNNIKKYLELSRIEILKNKIDDFINSAKKELVAKAGISVIIDSVIKVNTGLERALLQIRKHREVVFNQNDELERKLNKARRELIEKYNIICSEILEYRKELLNGVEACKDINDLKTFSNIEIGEEGYVIDKKIESIVRKHSADLGNTVVNIEGKIYDTIKQHNKFHDELLKALSNAGAKFGEKIVSASKSNVMKKLFEIRRQSEILKNIITFKGGGTATKWAAKWADRIKIFGKALKTLPILVEFMDIISELRFNDEKQKLKSIIEDLFKGFLEDFTIEAFEKDYFSVIKDIEELNNELKMQAKSLSEIYNKGMSYLNEMADLLKKDNILKHKNSPHLG